MKLPLATRLLAVCLLGALGAGTAWADDLSGCVNKRTGVLRISTKCKKTEAPLVFSTAGMQGIQGPKGDTGPQGPKGDTGAAGPRGPKGDVGPVGADAIKVYDANNQFLGYLVGGGSSNNNFSDTILVPSLNATISVYGDGDGSVQAEISQAPSPSFNTYRIYYATSDCTGTAYFAPAYNIQNRIFSLSDFSGASAPLVKYGIVSQQPIEITLRSFRYQGSNSVCIDPPNPFQKEVIENYKFTEVTLPFNTPILLPLRYEAAGN